MSDTKAALTLGIGRSTLSGWKKEHPDLDEWLAMAREQFRETKLAIVDEARTRDGRPDWRAAAWALEKAFPEDYGKPARPRRVTTGGRMGWKQAAAVLEQAFPEEYGDPFALFALSAVSAKSRSTAKNAKNARDAASENVTIRPEIPRQPRELCKIRQRSPE